MNYRKAMADVKVVGIEPPDTVIVSVKYRGRDITLRERLTLGQTMTLMHETAIDLPMSTRTGAAWHTLLDILGYEPEVE